MTTFPDLLRQLGGAPVGTKYGFKQGSTAWFVDGDASVTGDGRTLQAPFKTIYEAIAAADAWDVIYVAPKAWVSGNLWLGTTYQDTTDLAIAYAKQGLALVGTGHQGMIGAAYGPTITEVSASTAALLKIHAPECAVENLSFYRAATAVNGIYIYGDVAGTSEAVSASIYNCHFHGIVSAGATGDTGGAVYSHAAWGTTVDNCTFMDCRIGVSLKSDAGTAGKGIVRNCNFSTRQTTGTLISADVYVYTQGSACFDVYNCRMGHEIPAYSGGHGRYVLFNADVRQGSISNITIGVAADGTTALTVGPTGTGIVAPAGIAIGPCWSEGQLCAWSA